MPMPTARTMKDLTFVHVRWDSLEMENLARVSWPRQPISDFCVHVYDLMIRCGLIVILWKLNAGHCCRVPWGFVGGSGSNNFASVYTARRFPFACYSSPVYIYLTQWKLLWQLVIGNWALGIWAYQHNAMLCLSDRQTITSQCAIANCKLYWIRYIW